AFVLDAEAIEEPRQELLRLPVHEVDVPALASRARCRSSIAVARKDESAIPAGIAQPLRIVLPHSDRAQALVQEHDERRFGSFSRKPAILDAHRTSVERDVDELAITPDPARARATWTAGSCR